MTPFYPYTVYHGFDADKDECERLNRDSHPYQKMTVFPYYVGRDRQDIVFNLYKRRGESSSYLPGTRYKAIFAGDDEFVVEQQVKLTSSSLEEIYSKEAIEPPDFIKLDTQGSELDILRGAERIVGNACMVEAEVEFVEMYEGQPLFHEVFKFMHDSGFELLYLNRVFGQRQRVSRGESRGQPTFGDALFGRREDRLKGFSNARLTKYALLLINYGHIDFASQLLKTHPGILAQLPTLNSRISANTSPSRLKQAYYGQLDKLILLLLHARKTNGSLYDSDRSWPVR